MQHLRDVHQRTKVPREELFKDVRGVARCNDRRRLIMTEAIIIKEERPALNSQLKDATGYLKYLSFNKLFR